MKKIIFGLILYVFAFSASAQKLVLSDLQFFKELGVPVLQSHPRLSMGVADLSSVSDDRLHQVAHALGRCGGFEDLGSEITATSFNIVEELKELEKVRSQKIIFSDKVVQRPEVMGLTNKVSPERLKQLVLWMEGFGTRNHKASQPNRPVEALEARLKEILKSSKIPYSITLIDHSRTRQKSVKLSFSGHKTPGQKIILGAHFDSIAGWGMGDAPGADDNASGSANLIEVAQILSQSRQPQKTIEFFWYAGEEGGLIGSGEIAKTYKAQNEKVIAVMQLDMTAFPGDGPFQIGSVTDYTTPWVREFLSRVNQAYFQFKVNEFECGYGCSDHASWFRQGFETVAPFEARMQSMNRAIHTSKDRVQPSYNFEHSAAFSKLALAFALELDHASDLVK